MLTLFTLIIGLFLGFLIAQSKYHKTHHPQKKSSMFRHQNFHQKLHMKAHHQSESDRIRELNLLNSNQSIFLRQLKQNFPKHDIAIKDRRFIVLDQDLMPRAIFEYRDGTEPMKVIDREDGLPLFLYKGLISSDALKHDHSFITSRQN